MDKEKADFLDDLDKAIQAIKTSVPENPEYKCFCVVCQRWYLGESQYRNAEVHKCWKEYIKKKDSNI
jgi:hypothetical protein